MRNHIICSKAEIMCSKPVKAKLTEIASTPTIGNVVFEDAIQMMASPAGRASDTYKFLQQAGWFSNELSTSQPTIFKPLLDCPGHQATVQLVMINDDPKNLILHVIDVQPIQGQSLEVGEHV